MKLVCLHISLLVIAFTAVCLPACSQSNIGRDKFIHLKDAVPGIQYDIRYAGSNNFLGRKVKGYEAAEALLTKEAAAALQHVQADLKKQGRGLKVFDAYRPQRAVDDFVAWAKNPSDTVMKRAYYPDVPKSELFKRGYIASRSGHTRGSTVDLTVIDLKTGNELDMGSPYDFFGEISHHETKALTPAQRANRNLLKSAMEKHGFRAYDKEWWHYTLNKEPYPDTYFDFPVRRDR